MVDDRWGGKHESCQLEQGKASEHARLTMDCYGKNLSARILDQYLCRTISFISCTYSRIGVHDNFQFLSFQHEDSNHSVNWS